MADKVSSVRREVRVASQAVQPVMSPDDREHKQPPVTFFKGLTEARSARHPKANSTTTPMQMTQVISLSEVGAEKPEHKSIHPAVAAALRAQGSNGRIRSSISAVVPADAPMDVSRLRRSVQTRISNRKSSVVSRDTDAFSGVVDLTASSWQPPQLDKALEYGRGCTFLEGSAHLWNTRIVDIAVLGPGVSMYFWMLKGLALTFFIMGFLLIPIMLVASTGSRISANDMDVFGFARISVGNIGTVATESCTNGTCSSNNQSNLLLPTVDMPAFGSISTEAAGYLVSTCDVLSVAVFLAFIVLFRRKVEDYDTTSKAVEKVKDSSSYTVFIRDLPKDATEDEIRNHFSSLYGLHKPDWGFPGYCFGLINRKRSRFPHTNFHRFIRHDDAVGGERAPGSTASTKYPLPVENVNLSKSPGFYGSWVADVTVVKGTTNEIRTYLAIQELSKKLQNARARLEIYGLDHLGRYRNAKKYAKAKAEMDSQSRRLNALLLQLRKLDTITGERRHSTIAVVPAKSGGVVKPLLQGNIGGIRSSAVMNRVSIVKSIAGLNGKPPRPFQHSGSSGYSGVSGLPDGVQRSITKATAARPTRDMERQSSATSVSTQDADSEKEPDSVVVTKVQPAKIGRLWLGNSTASSICKLKSVEDDDVVRDDGCQVTSYGDGDDRECEQKRAYDNDVEPEDEECDEECDGNATGSDNSDEDDDDDDDYNVYGGSSNAPMPKLSRADLRQPAGLTILLDDYTRRIMPLGWDIVRKTFEAFGALGFCSEAERRQRLTAQYTKSKRYSLVDAVMAARASFLLGTDTTDQPRSLSLVFQSVKERVIGKSSQVKRIKAREPTAQRSSVSAAPFYKLPLPHKKARLYNHRASVQDQRTAQHISKERSTTYSAFVVFNHEESFRRCVEDYRSSKSTLGRLFQPPPLRFKGQRIIVQPAMEPSTVLWENLDCTEWNRSIRRAVTFLVSLSLLIVSFGVMYYAQESRLSFSSEVPDETVCKLLIPASLIHLNTTPTPNDIKSPEFFHDPARDNICKTSTCLPYTSRCAMPNSVFVAVKESPTPSPPTTLSKFYNKYNVSDTDVCTSPCFSQTLAMNVQCNTSDPRTTYPAAIRLNCYCYNVLNTYISASGVFAGGYQFIQEQSSVCGDYGARFLDSQLLKLATSFILVVINLLLRISLRAMTHFERHVSTSERDSALTWKLFLGEYLNTGVLALFMFEKLPVSAELLFGLRLFDGEFAGMPPRWYAVVGSYLIVTLIVDATTPVLMTVLKIVLSFLRRTKWFVQWKLTQDELNQLFVGPQFFLATKLSGILNAVFVSVMYGGGLPVLIPMAAMGFTAQYWTEKVAVLRYYKKSSHYSIELPRVALRMLPYAALVNAIQSIWMYGDSKTLQSRVLSTSGSSDLVAPIHVLKSAYLAIVEVITFGNGGKVSEGLRRYIVVPLVVALMIVVIGLVAYYVYFAGKRVLAAIEANRRMQGESARFQAVNLCGMCRRGRPVGALAEEKAIDFSPGFTEVYAQWLGQYFGKSSDQLDIDVNAEDQKQGWKIELGKEGCLWLCKVWTDTGTVDGIKHVQGQYKRTWEVLRDEGTHSYRMLDNEKYKYALRTQIIVFESGQRNRRESIKF